MGSKCLVIILLSAAALFFSAGAAELLVCWGAAGDVPAVALLESGREPLVLLPGGAEDGAELASALLAAGQCQLSELLMPTGAPFPRGAARIAAVCGLRRLVVLHNARSRTPTAALYAKLTKAGTAIHTCNQAGRFWRVALGDWRVTYEKQKGEGAFRLSFFQKTGESLSPIFYCEQRMTGVFAVGREAAPKPLLEVPKCNRAGSKRIALPAD